MAYGEKYKHEYCNSYGVDCKVSILQIDYIGSSIELEAQPIPFVKTYDSENKYSPLRPSTGSVNFIFNTENGVEFEEIWTADEREYQVIHYIDGAIDWIGYIIPNGFDYELTGGLYYATITAGDGLSTLADLDFIYTDGENYGTQDLVYNNGFEFPFVLIITEILRKLDLDLNLWTCIDIYEQSMTKTGDTRNADPLATSYIDVRTYIEDSNRKDIPYWKDVNEAMDCKTVLENICTMFHASVYQNRGVWRIKRWPVDQNYGSGDTQRYWRKYNTLAVYIPGYVPLNNEVVIPCSSVDKVMIGTDHLIRMSEVYGAFRMNYKFQLKREGDEPEVLLKNGDFVNFNESSKEAAPDYWFRWHWRDEWGPRLKSIDITGEIPDTEYTKAIVMGQQPDGVSGSNLDSEVRAWNSLRYEDPIPISKGDLMYFSGWVKIRLAYKTNFISAIFGLQLKADSGQYYTLMNSNTSGLDKDLKNTSWVKIEVDKFYKTALGTAIPFLDARKLQVTTFMFDDYDSSNADDFIWRKFNIDLPPIPESGSITFDIHGLVNTNRKSAKDRIKVKNIFTNREDWLHEVQDGIRSDTKVPYMQVTGLSIGRIKNPTEYAEEQDYLYYNQGKYSLEVEPLEVLNGDVLDPSHLSRIIVPTNTSGLKNFWDLIDDKFGKSSLGLIAVKSIMSLYYKPFKLLDGSVKSEDIDIDTRFVFDAIPGVTFGILKGGFNEKDNYLEDATFFELSTADIPAGGIEGGTDLNPRPVGTGGIRCKKESGLNTGALEIQIIDSNSNSPSYGTTDWGVNGQTDLVMCPIGEPDRYLWGTDAAGYDENNFTNNTFYVDEDEPNEVTVGYDNPGGQYIYFLHLSSLGVVEVVETDQQSNVISDFQYLTDITILGYTYRVLRQNYITAEFESLSITFKFNL